MYQKTINTAVLLLLLLVGGNSQAAIPNPQLADTASAVKFENSMRMLWEEHVSWTRAYLISAFNNLDDKAVVLQRLLRNQSDIGDSVKPYYGTDAGNQLTSLLTTHINIAGNLITAMSANDTANANVAMVAWQSNANDIAVFLNKANPSNWALADLQAMMTAHLNATTTEVKAEFAKDWIGSVNAYDTIETQILMMADTLSQGIIKQFPDRFTTKIVCE